MKKVIWIILFIIIIGLGLGGYFYYQSKKLVIEYEKIVEVNIFDSYENTKAIKKIKNGTIKTKTKNIDTSILGKQEIMITIMDYFNNTKKISYVLNVVDKEPPKITFNDKLTVEENGQINLLNGVEVTDNSKEEIKAEVEGEYHIETPGTYELYYVAKDSSGNVAKEKFTLEVIKKVVVQPTYQNQTSIPDKDFITTNGHKGTVRGGVTYIDGVLIANKTYTLPSTYNPGMQEVFMSHFNEMQSAAASAGINIRIISGFRSYSNQKSVYAGWVNKYGQKEADTISARPGHSEHQSGLAADINSLDQSFEYTPEGKWLNDNCYKYGFIIRYIKGKENETGYAFEPWHIRYVGKDLAKVLYNNGNWITMESYFGITSRYS